MSRIPIPPLESATGATAAGFADAELADVSLAVAVITFTNTC